MSVRIEFPSRGATYCNQKYGVYEYGVYSGRSVLAGQTRRTWLGEYDTLEEARAKHPNADYNDCGSGFVPVNVSRIAPNWFDESDAGERWDDDY